jgi:hypothetical protein
VNLEAPDAILVDGDDELTIPAEWMDDEPDGDHAHDRPRDHAGGDGDGRKTQATLLAELALSRYDAGINQTTRIPFVVPKRGPRVARPLRGGQPPLSAELVGTFYRQYGTVPSANALTSAFQLIEAVAHEKPPMRLHNRVARADDAIVLDLGRVDGRVAVVDEHGWTITDDSPALFLRTNTTLELPEPERGGSLEPLRGLLNVTDEQWNLIVAWLVAALVPGIPHPILAFEGEQGTGKSDATRLLAMTLDPRVAPTMSLPTGQREWTHMASKRHVLAFDNVSHIEPWLSDALCRGVTGEGWVERTFYTNDDEFPREFQCCILMNGIATGSPRGDLAERTIRLPLERIPPTARVPESELRDRFTTTHGAVLGALLDLAAVVLAELPNVEPAELPRMADFAKLTAAVDGVRGTSALKTYMRLAAELNADVVDGDPVAVVLEQFARTEAPWQGTPAELLAKLNAWREGFAPGRYPPPAPRGWPGSPQVLGQALARLAPALQTRGVLLEQRRSDGRRLWVLTVVPSAPGVSA